MQFQKNSRGLGLSSLIKNLIKLLLLCLILFIGVILIDKIKFPVPSKTIEKKVPNANFKIIK
tara:strand:+ start:58 stop:243 length:186 start_codon:yes stop_codon:yes gene_type:complete